MRGIADLSLEQAPPLWTPFLFLFGAPWFGVLAGALLLKVGALPVLDRWQGAALALTHLLTLGVLTLSMCGASIQLLPVLVGVPVPRVRWVAAWTWPLLVAGTLALAWGFLEGGTPWLVAGAAGTLAGLAPFLVAMGLALARARVSHHSLRAMALACVSLAVTLVLGALLVAGLGGYRTFDEIVLLAGLHLSWGLLGWVGLLLAGVAWQVVPLFQMTPEYPPLVRRFLAPGLFLWLVTTLPVSWLWPGLWPWILLPALLGMAWMAALTLQLQRRRTRKTPDLTLDYWRLGMACLLAALAVWPLGALWGGPWVWWLGTLMLPGGVLSLLNGMLLKIVPFLSWFHLQHRQMAHLRERGGLVEIPHMHALLPTTLGRWQWRLHLLALMSALATPAAPGLLARVTGGLLVAAYGLLGLAFIRVWLGYRSAQGQFG